MSVIRIAGNLIPGADPIYRWGHLQLVKVDGTSQEEIEVQAPGTITLGSWEFVSLPRDHTNPDLTPGYGDANDYAYSTLDIGGRDPEEVWSLLKSIHNGFLLNKLAGEEIPYDFNQNSNSYINTLLYMVGIAFDPVTKAVVTPSSVVHGFPGIDTNVITNGAATPNFNLSLTSGNDVLKTGGGNDVIDGEENNDTIEGGLGNDEILGGDGNDSIKGGGGNDTINGGMQDDFLEGGDDNDTYVFTSTGFGDDIINDDNGKLIIGGHAVKQNIQSNLVANGNGTYTMSHQGENYTLSLDSLGQDLVIEKGPDSITIKDFTDGTFGISLSGRVFVAAGPIMGMTLNRLADGSIAVTVSEYGPTGTEDGRVYANTQSDDEFSAVVNFPYTQHGPWNYWGGYGGHRFAPVSSPIGDDNVAISSFRVIYDSEHSAVTEVISRIDSYDASGNLEHSFNLLSHLPAATYNSFGAVVHWISPAEDGGVNVFGYTHSGHEPSSIVTQWLIRLDEDLQLKGPIIEMANNQVYTPYYLDADSVEVGEESFLKEIYELDPDSQGRTRNVYLQETGFDGAPLGARQFLKGLHQGENSDEFGLNVTRLDNHSSVMSWSGYTNIDDAGYAIVRNYFQILYDNGARSEIVSVNVEPRDSWNWNNSSITALDNGAFIFSGAERATNSSFTQAYDNRGNELGGKIYHDESLTSLGVQYWRESLSVEAIPNFGYAVVWNEFDGEMFGYDFEAKVWLQRIAVDAPLYPAPPPSDGYTYDVRGTTGDDSIHGSSSDDVIGGGWGDDDLAGGEGVDTYIYRPGDGNDTISDSGNNKLVLQGISYEQVSISIGSLVLTIGNAEGSIRLLGFNTETPELGAGISEFEFGDGSVLSLADILDIGVKLEGTADDNYLTGTNIKDNIFGGAGNDLLVSIGGADQLNGGEGDDTLDGGDGIDDMRGGPGNDVYWVNESGDLIVDEEGYELVLSTAAGYTLPENLEDLRLSGEAIAGTGNALGNYIEGNELVNWLEGKNGNDTLYAIGSTGADTLLGGAGDDSYYVNDEARVVELADEGIDWVEVVDASTTHTFTLLDNVEHLALTATTYLSGTGNELDNEIVGNKYYNVITGWAGNDQIDGGNGSDRLFGGDGNDSIRGGNDQWRSEPNGIFSKQDLDAIDNGGSSNANAAMKNSDYIEAGAGSDTVDGGSGNDEIYGGDGDDYLYGGSNGGYVISNGYGSLPPVLLSNDDTIYGGAGNDEIRGGSGDDSLVGGEGFDTYIFLAGGDLDVISDEGANQLYFENLMLDQLSVSSSGPLTIQVIGADDEVRLIAFNPQNPSAGAGITEFKFADGSILSLADILNHKGASVIEGTASNNTLEGTAGADIIRGLGGHDTLNGNDGNDQLVGGTGNDVMAGGAGDDVFIVEGTGQGTDRFDGGDGQDELRGSAQDDVFTISTFAGTATVDLIDGRDGENHIEGTASNNELDFSSTVLAGIAYVDARGGHDTVIGSSNSDTIIGGTGNDVLEGRDGDDTFIIEGSSQGTDRFEGGSGYDVLLGVGSTGTFTMSTFTGVATVEMIDGSGGAYQIHGTASNNILDFGATELLNIERIDGGAGHDTVTGSAAADLLVGGTGNDVLYGGAGDDVFLTEGTEQGTDLYSGGEGADELRGSVSDDDFTIAMFTGDSSVELIDGKEGNNRILGTASNNPLNFASTVLVGIALIDAAGGHDTVTGSADADTIIGGTGNDVLDGGTGNDVFIVEGAGQGTDNFTGGDGSDELRGGSSEDTFVMATFAGAATVEKIDGKGGINRIVGTASNNTFDFTGIELVGIENIDMAGGHDTVTGSALDDLIIGGSGNDVLDGGAGNDVFIVEGVDQGTDRFTGGDGVDELRGSAGDDTFIMASFAGAATVEIIDGKNGANRVVGTASNNSFDFSNTELIAIELIDMGAGHDTVTGSVFDDLIVGGTGNDSLQGNEGSDIYVYAPGSGIDSIQESSNVADIDVIRFDGEVDHKDLWFSRSGDSLVLQQVGSTDRITIKGWYGSPGNQVERIETETFYIESSEINALVTAMAGFTPPVGLSGVLTQQMEDALFPLFASAWQTV